MVRAIARQFLYELLLFLPVSKTWDDCYLLLESQVDRPLDFSLLTSNSVVAAIQTRTPLTTCAKTDGPLIVIAESVPT